MLFTVILGLSLLAGPDSPLVVDELRGPRKIVELRELSGLAAAHWRLTAPTDGPLPDQDYQPVTTARSDQIEILAGLKWKQRPRADGVLELDIDNGWAGGRILAWRVADGLMVEKLTYGSGVHIARAQRFKLATVGRH
jgi:catechol 2,3-dioxygenase-like lactoylglutathione lyase family enzyme